MKNKSKYIFSIITFFFVMVLLYFFFIRNTRENKLIKKGNKLIERIEKFKQERGSLPNSLTEIGIEETESGPLYYQKEDSLNYIIFFGTSLGESKTYYSNIKKWK